jgi:hypothetical protein
MVQRAVLMTARFLLPNFCYDTEVLIYIWNFKLYLIYEQNIRNKRLLGPDGGREN